MALRERIYSVLFVSSIDSFNDAAMALLPASRYQPVCIAASVSQARRYLAGRSFDFVIVNAPLPDENGVRFAIDCCRCPNTVVLILARAETFADVHGKVSEHGVFAIPKPLSRGAMQQALNWMVSARERLRQLEEKTCSIEQRMEEIRLVNRAKWLLISELKMTEPEAHRYIEKAAMDDCISKADAARRVIKLYS